MTTHITDTDFRNWSLLAGRALDDCFRVLETIDPESTSEGEKLSELKTRVSDLFTQALALNGVLTRRELEDITGFGKIDLSTRTAQRPIYCGTGYCSCIECLFPTQPKGAA